MPKRVQMTRQKPWRADNPDAVIVSRPSMLGNPFPVAMWGRELSVALFENSAQGTWNPSTLGQDKSDEQFAVAYKQHTDWLARIIDHPVDVARSLLAGRDLACWCSLDQPCHADVLLELANQEATA